MGMGLAGMYLTAAGSAVSTALPYVAAAGTLFSAASQKSAGNISAKEAELTGQTQEVAATQREADRKDRLAAAIATANAQAGAAGIAQFEGSPLTVLNESLRSEEVATDRDAFNTRIAALTTRSRGQSAKRQGQIGAATTLIRGASTTAQLIPED